MTALSKRAVFAGFIDPVSLITLGVLAITLVGSLIAVKVTQQSTENRSAALPAEPCKMCVHGACSTVASPPNCSSSFNDCSACPPPTPKPPQPTAKPQPTSPPPTSRPAGCAGKCVTSSFVCSPNTPKSGNCPSGQKCVADNAVCASPTTPPPPPTAIPTRPPPTATPEIACSLGTYSCLSQTLCVKCIDGKYYTGTQPHLVTGSEIGSCPLPCKLAAPTNTPKPQPPINPSPFPTITPNPYTCSANTGKCVTSNYICSPNTPKPGSCPTGQKCMAEAAACATPTSPLPQPTQTPKPNATPTSPVPSITFPACTILNGTGRCTDISCCPGLTSHPTTSLGFCHCLPPNTPIPTKPPPTNAPAPPPTATPTKPPASPTPTPILFRPNGSSCRENRECQSNYCQNGTRCAALNPTQPACTGYYGSGNCPLNCCPGYISRSTETAGTCRCLLPPTPTPAPTKPPATPTPKPALTPTFSPTPSSIHNCLVEQSYSCNPQRTAVLKCLPNPISDGQTILWNWQLFRSCNPPTSVCDAPACVTPTPLPPDLTPTAIPTLRPTPTPAASSTPCPGNTPCQYSNVPLCSDEQVRICSNRTNRSTCTPSLSGGYCIPISPTSTVTANDIIGTAQEIVADCQPGFWGFYNNCPGYNNFNYQEYQKTGPDHCAYANGDNCTGDYKTLQNPDSLMWCTGLVQTVAKINGIELQPNMGVTSMVDDFNNHKALTTITATDTKKITAGQVIFMGKENWRQFAHVGIVSNVQLSANGKTGYITILNTNYADKSITFNIVDGKIQPLPTPSGDLTINAVGDLNAY